MRLVPPVNISTEDKMKLVAFNIRYGLGLDQRVDLGRITEAVRDADLLLCRRSSAFGSIAA